MEYHTDQLTCLINIHFQSSLLKLNRPELFVLEIQTAVMAKIDRLKLQKAQNFKEVNFGLKYFDQYSSNSYVIAELI